MIENKFVTNESSFVEMEWWDACVDVGLSPVIADKTLSVWVGLDASHKRDQTAIVACTFDSDSKRVRLAWHRVFQPSRKNPLDFEATVEASMLELRDRFIVKRVLYDPHMLQSPSQRLIRAGLPMEEYPQTSNRLEEMGTNLYELIKGRNLRTYSDKEMRLAVSRAVAVETPRGWKIAKEKTSHKIDVVVALAMAALGAVESQGRGVGGPVLFTAEDVPHARTSPKPARSAGSPKPSRCSTASSAVTQRCPTPFTGPTITTSRTTARRHRARSYEGGPDHHTRRVHSGVRLRQDSTPSGGRPCQVSARLRSGGARDRRRGGDDRQHRCVVRGEDAPWKFRLRFRRLSPAFRPG